MTDLYSPAELATLTGLSVGNQRTWRRDGFFRKHGVQSPGGYWSFTRQDVLFVAAVRTIAKRGLDLNAAAMVADTFLLEILAAVQRTPREPGEAKYIFVWKREDCTFEAEDALAEGRLHFERWTEAAESPARQAVLHIYQSGDWCAVQTNYLDADLPRLSRAGGILMVPDEIGWSIPPAVADLFKASAAP